MVANFSSAFEHMVVLTTRRAGKRRFEKKRAEKRRMLFIRRNQ
jgi:hypothetical protein